MPPPPAPLTPRSLRCTRSSRWLLKGLCPWSGSWVSPGAARWTRCLSFGVGSWKTASLYRVGVTIPDWPEWGFGEVLCRGLETCACNCTVIVAWYAPHKNPPDNRVQPAPMDGTLHSSEHGAVKKARTDFQKDLFKLLNNSVFGNTMENLRKRVRVKLMQGEDKARRQVAKPSFVSFKVFNNILAAVHMRKTELLLNRLIWFHNFTLLLTLKLASYSVTPTQAFCMGPGVCVCVGGGGFNNNNNNNNNSNNNNTLYFFLCGHSNKYWIMIGS